MQFLVGSWTHTGTTGVGPITPIHTCRPSSSFQLASLAAAGKAVHLLAVLLSIWVVPGQRGVALQHLGACEQIQRSQSREGTGSERKPGPLHSYVLVMLYMCSGCQGLSNC
jgi:hypothetical protein